MITTRLSTYSCTFGHEWRLKRQICVDLARTQDIRSISCSPKLFQDNNMCPRGNNIVGQDDNLCAKVIFLCKSSWNPGLEVAAGGQAAAAPTHWREYHIIRAEHHRIPLSYYAVVRACRVVPLHIFDNVDKLLLYVFCLHDSCNYQCIVYLSLVIME